MTVYQSYGQDALAVVGILAWDMTAERCPCLQLDSKRCSLEQGPQAGSPQHQHDHVPDYIKSA